jgi:CPA1 family monovalent cation:H+ antiporter
MEEMKMNEEVLYIPVILASVIGLIALNGLSYYSQKSKAIPEVAWVLLLGILYGLAADNTSMGLPELTLSADLILFIFVPLLIFGSTQTMCLHHFRKVLAPASLTATVGISISMFVTAFVLMALTDISLLESLIFGVVVAATDPLAIGAILEGNKKLSENMKLLIEGESILNDGFVVTVFGILTLIVFENHIFSVVGVVGGFIFHVAGAIILGVVLGRVARFILKIWHAMQFTLVANITIALAFGSFLLADHYNMSGVLAVFAAALSFGYKQENLSKEFHLQEYVWDYGQYVANSVLFFLLGASVISQGSLSELRLAQALVVLITLLGSRIIALVVLRPFIKVDGAIISWLKLLVLNFAGARGAVSIALILLLPDSFVFKATFLNMTFLLVLGSLLLFPPITSKLIKQL